MEDGFFVLARLQAGVCTEEDLRQFFAGENICVTNISRVDSDFIVTPNTEKGRIASHFSILRVLNSELPGFFEDHQKLLERGCARIEFEGAEFELIFESVDGDIVEKLKSQEDKSSENSGEYKSVESWSQLNF